MVHCYIDNRLSWLVDCGVLILKEEKRRGREGEGRGVERGER